MLDSIDELIERQAKTNKVIKPIDLIPKKIILTEGAFKKSQMIGPLVKEITGGTYEWSAFLLAKKGDPAYIVRDLILQKGQEIQFGNVEISGEDVAKTNELVEKRNKANGTDLYVIGWVHGHGNAYALLPSGVDENNFQVVLNSVALNTEQITPIPLNLIETETIKRYEDGKLIYSGSASEDAIIKLTHPNVETLEEILRREGITLKNFKGNGTKFLSTLLQSINIDHYQNTIFGFSYFLIMSNNKNTQPYGAISLLTEKAITKSKTFETIKDVEVKATKVKKDIIITLDSLKKEIKDNIKIPAGRIFVAPGFRIWRGRPHKYPGFIDMDEYGEFPTRTSYVPYVSSIYSIREFVEVLGGKVLDLYKRGNKEVSELLPILKLMGEVVSQQQTHSYLIADAGKRQREVIDAFLKERYGSAPDPQKPVENEQNKPLGDGSPEDSPEDNTSPDTDSSQPPKKKIKPEPGIDGDASGFID